MRWARSAAVLTLGLLASAQACSDGQRPARATSVGASGGPAASGAAGTSSSAGNAGRAGDVNSGGSASGGSAPDGFTTGGATIDAAGAFGDADDDAHNSDVSFEASTGIILNPERGFFATTSLVETQDLSMLRQSGVTLVHSYVRLDDYRTSDLPQSLFTQVNAGFERVRAAGLKVILRFAYNFGPYPDSEPDAPKAWVLKHIAQLEPLLRQNADVIAVVQAGFIGAWGEWHTSTNNLTEPATRQAILEALLGAVPTSRFVQLRYPAYKQALYGDALTAQTAFGATPAARVGHHNDCFVSSPTDVGTYPDEQVDFFRDYVAADSAFVPMGGETCAVDPPRSECSSTIDEMTKLHMSYVNREFQSDVVAGWTPCRDELEKRLGYRLVIAHGALPEAVKPGGSFTLDLQLKNDGFAAPFNARPVFLVLRGNGTTTRVQLLKADPRRWLGEPSLRARLRLPSKLPPGSYSLSLWLPDAAETLQSRPEYSLRLANEQTWDEATGENLLGKLDVTVEALGTAVTNADAFALLDE